jgi:hypothetical protein
MISFRPVVEDGVSSRREKEKICFSKARSPLNSGTFFSKLLRGSSCLSWSNKAAAVGIAIPFSWRGGASGFAGPSGDPLIGTRRDPQYGRVDCDRP